MGNAVLPLLEIHPLLYVHALDIAKSAIDILRWANHPWHFSSPQVHVVLSDPPPCPHTLTIPNHFISLTHPRPFYADTLPLRAHPLTDTGRLRADVCDVVTQPLPPPRPPGGLDYALCMFVLSAMAPQVSMDTDTWILYDDLPFHYTMFRTTLCTAWLPLTQQWMMCIIPHRITSYVMCTNHKWSVAPSHAWHFWRSPPHNVSCRHAPPPSCNISQVHQHVFNKLAESLKVGGKVLIRDYARCVYWSLMPMNCRYLAVYCYLRMHAQNTWMWRGLQWQYIPTCVQLCTPYHCDPLSLPLCATDTMRLSWDSRRVPRSPITFMCGKMALVPISFPRMIFTGLRLGPD